MPQLGRDQITSARFIRYPNTALKGRSFTFFVPPSGSKNGIRCQGLQTRAKLRIPVKGSLLNLRFKLIRLLASSTTLGTCFGKSFGTGIRSGNMRDANSQTMQADPCLECPDIRGRAVLANDCPEFVSQRPEASSLPLHCASHEFPRGIRLRIRQEMDAGGNAMRIRIY